MSTEARNEERATPKRNRWLWITCVCVLIVITAVVVRAQLNSFADLSKLDTAPLPRKGLNAPFIKSADPVVDKMIELAEITDKDLVYDLGCGDGKIVINAAVQRGCRGVGFDIDPKRIAEAIENAQLHGVEGLVTFQEQDVFKVDLNDATVIVMYLLPWMVRDLTPQFEKCPPGTRIVSHDWMLEGIEDQVKVKVPVPDESDHLVYMYVTPLKRLPPKKPLESVIK